MIDDYMEFVFRVWLWEQIFAGRLPYDPTWSNIKWVEIRKRLQAQ